ncbi:MAG: VOC family protein [Actinomycetota bacterium]
MVALKVTSPVPPFEQLDFLYTPSSDVAADLAYFTEVLGGRVVFAIEAMGTRVAAIELTSGPPTFLLTDHVVGDRAILVFRVADLDAALASQEAAGWIREHTFDIPHGPCCSFVTPGGHRVALYQLTRPEAAEHFNGRRDF